MRMHLLARTAMIMAAALAFASPTGAAEPHWPDDLTIATASPGGTYYIYGAGLAQILTRDLGLPVVMRPTEGPAENIALLEAGEANLGFVTTGVALQAWNATGVWTGKTPARSLRAIFPMYDYPVPVSWLCRRPTSGPSLTWLANASASARAAAPQPSIFRTSSTP